MRKHEIGPQGQLQEPNDRSRWIALYVLCAGMLMIVLDVTIVNVALPTIQDDLGFSTANLAWVVNGYLIAFGSLLLLAGRVGDLIGRRAIFLSGLVVFTVASFFCVDARRLRDRQASGGSRCPRIDRLRRHGFG